MMIALKLLKCTVGSCMIVFIYVLFLRVLPSKSEEILDVEPAVEIKRLRSDLLKSYDKTQRPLKNQTQMSNVGVFFDLQHIISMDEKAQILSVTGTLMLFWTDEFLRWDPQSYSTIKKILFSPEDIWKPDVHSEYNVKQLHIHEENRETPVTASNNGSMEWFPQVQFDVPCSANYRHYPFDSHNCSVVLLAFGYNDSNVLMVPQRPHWMEPKMVKGTEWAVKEISHESETYAHYPSEGTTYQQVKIKILLERISRIYRYICVIPTLVAMVTLLLGFWLLPSESARYMIGCGNIIVLSMLLQHLAVTIPAGRDVPLLAQYSSSCLAMSAIFVTLTVISNLLRECNGMAPSALVRFAHFTADRYLCIFTFSHVPTGEWMASGSDCQGESSSMISPSPDELKRRKDWYAVSVLVDRMAFWCFAFIFVVLLTVLASI